MNDGKIGKEYQSQIKEYHLKAKNQSTNIE